MPNLLVRPEPAGARCLHITPESAGWTYVGFDLYRLQPGETAAAPTLDREACLVWIAGKGAANAGGIDSGVLGKRLSPFEGPPDALYVPAGSDWSVTAETGLELAVCTAPGGGEYAAKRIPPGLHTPFRRGSGSNLRHITNVMPEDDASAHSLLVVEVITPGGNTSSYPSHKHDRDDLPRESLLEETYYHRLNPSQGFAFQRVYTDADDTGRRAIDEAMAVSDGDVVLVPKGYHPCATIHGYDLYYLNVMAGPKRVWKFHTDPAHEWLSR